MSTTEAKTETTGGAFTIQLTMHDRQVLEGLAHRMGIKLAQVIRVALRKLDKEA